MNDQQKQDLVNLIIQEKERLGSGKAVATKCKISETAISQLVSGQYKTSGDDIWYKVAAALNYKPTSWQVVQTTNVQMIMQVLNDAKEESMFMAISHKAGSGKTATINAYTAEDRSNSIFTIQCREWCRRDLLINLAQTLGIELKRSYTSVDRIGEQIINFFKGRAFQKPQLIFDEADKLKPSALRYLIPLYNATEDGLSVIIAGTENLEKEIKRGAKNSIKGYDELDSRFGRSFIHLIGATRSDINKICAANGIPDRTKQNEIFKELKPIKIMVDGQSIEVIEDMRRVKRAIKRELLTKFQYQLN